MRIAQCYNITRSFVYFFTGLMLALATAATYANPVIPIPTQPKPKQIIFTPSAPNLNSTSYILMDAISGRVLAEKNAHVRMPPASLTKLMSMYIISSALKDGQIKLTDKVRISTKAWKTEGSRMFVKVNDEVPVHELIKGIVVVSGNDATVAMAEHVAGSEDSFTTLMNQQAEAIGMKNSHFTDSTGLPDPNHYSTAYDFALLTREYIKNFPQDYIIYAEKWFSYNNIRQPNRNRLLWNFPSADGLKTGHTNEAGYCLVASAKKNGMRLISVVLGEPSDSSRTEDSMRLLTYGFRFFETHKAYSANKQIVHSRVWQGINSDLDLGVTNDMYVTVPTGQYRKVETKVALNNPLQAPIIKGQIYGNLNIMLNGQIIAAQPLIALRDNPRGGLFRRAADSISFRLDQYFSKSDSKPNPG